jgi:beta-galactosidase
VELVQRDGLPVLCVDFAPIQGGARTYSVTDTDDIDTPVTYDEIYSMIARTTSGGGSDEKELCTALVRVEYRIFPDGSLSVTEQMRDGGRLAQAPHLFRFGMRLALDGTLSTVDYLGLGPWENYADRCSGALFGHYVQSVNEMYHYGYVRPQEAGTRTGLRRFRVLDAGGTGLEFSASPFSASALPFSREDLDVCAPTGDSIKRDGPTGQCGISAHSLELKALAHENDRSNGSTWVCVDAQQMGVGGITTWRTTPLTPYMIEPRERSFHFVLRPIVK